MPKTITQHISDARANVVSAIVAMENSPDHKTYEQMALPDLENASEYLERAGIEARGIESTKHNVIALRAEVSEALVDWNGTSTAKTTEQMLEELRPIIKMAQEANQKHIKAIGAA